jgi:hypothetical protein
VLLTTGTPEAHALLAGSLPRRVVLQCAPFENAASVTLFLRSWRPQVRPLLCAAQGVGGAPPPPPLPGSCTRCCALLLDPYCQSYALGGASILAWRCST